jgi:rod shape-determining protein MreD
MSQLTFPRVLVIVATLLTATVVQSAVLARLGLPGATPDLLLVAVLVIAMAAGPLVGSVVGFAGGVLADLAPPAAGSIGQSAALYALAGFVIGQAEFEATKPELTAVLSIGGLSVLVVLVQAILGTLFGQPEVTWSLVPFLLFTQFAYSLLLAVVLIPVLGQLYRGASGEEGRFA